MGLEWVGPTPTAANTPAQECPVNTARSGAQPHLADLASTAIAALDRQSSGQQKGFFLQIEGASIDKQGHAAKPCGQIGETVEFDKAVKAALATLTTHDGAPMTISHAATRVPGSQQHTGTEVRIAAVGPQAANVLGVTNQTDLNTTMRRPSDCSDSRLSPGPLR